ncbi:HlyD family efflux transporter periplasmic adaptor subunit [Lysobacter sp. A6]|uniref:HlyD family efflux transporter periplasmic adaptor subunit n=1 Tax=Noviluteimonas lactosilytica TaxID=2888523 RepID=A0ABS8JJV2_9GAMM|nr:HlyD family efflux transporter periplasmic adaptor subunit [Lysobacter lactosilyticus]MCC8363890.1 HlyD family efflux transporter periplasmic adaptor subunit [Lysobacter lactosilyticus]
MTAPHPRLLYLCAIVAIGAASCRNDAPQALGTLEYDRITLPAPAAEKIIAIDVREGQRVKPGQSLLRLELDRTRSATEAARASALRQRATLEEMEAGPRSEEIARARAELVAAQAQVRDTRDYYNRVRQLGPRQLMAQSDIDRARAQADNAAATARALAEALRELEAGTRSEQIAAGEAALAASEADAAAQQVTLDKLSVIAPRAGVVDSIPFKLGDQAAVGQPLAILLVGNPYARVYVQEPIRANVAVGTKARVFIGGRDEAIDGTVRMIRTEPTFTPYFALIGKDAARLSWVAEIALQTKDALPAGLPVRVEFDK